jgi:hypothetical protein
LRNNCWIAIEEVQDLDRHSQNGKHGKYDAHANKAQEQPVV